MVFVSYLLHLLRSDERRQVLETTSRLLRPRGRIVTITVDTPGAIPRGLLSLLPRWTGLHPLDPRPELECEGLHPVHAQYASTGWPSLVVLALD